ncbi:MAG TPA: xanthine dehydrogenase family protein molybdopterin-binding subunit [Symbiobacteriaceae bacterium]|nr:xanthine dehydrogenase family protein molybdopterin-binding subunit [Symbiobacteriaceae bacterium]
MTYQVIGTRPIRPDGVEKVTGRAVFGADVQLPGMLYGKVLRSPHAHARIVSIDTAAAAAMPGVYAVVTGADLPEVPMEPAARLGEDQTQIKEIILAGDKVLFDGHPVAAVAALSPDLAEAACRAIRVEYELLLPVTDILDAMKETAPLLHPNLYTNVWGGVRPEKPSNIAGHIPISRGDVAAGFAEADVIVEREFRTSMIHQGYIEPQVATAKVGEDGQVIIWTSTQGSFDARGQVAGLLDLPPGKIRVIPCEIGGGFGGKSKVYLEPLAVLLARKAGRPVQLVMTRAEVFKATGPDPRGIIRAKVGARRDGTITALEGWLAYEVGAFADSAVGSGVSCMFAPYSKVSNLRLDGYDVLTNRPRISAYRAPGAPNAAFAAESVIDELAAMLGIDPIELRLKNAVRRGDLTPAGRRWPAIGLVEALEAARATPHYQTPLQGPNRGRGVAAGFWGNWDGTSSVHLVINRDGSVALTLGAIDLSGSRASMAMIVAEELGIPYAQVKPQIGDTDSVGYSDVTGGSRSTVTTGWACVKAAQDARRHLCEEAARAWDCPVDEVAYVPGTGCVHGGEVLTLKELAEQGPIYGVGTMSGAGGSPAFAVHIADVEVDPDTGKVAILRYTAVQDVGRAIHPAYVEGQLQGAVAQSIGRALYEAYVYDSEGRLLNPNFLDYRLPTFVDVPPIETVLVEVPNPAHPYGVRGVGEAGAVPGAGALANAVCRATGHRLCDLPMTAEQICLASLRHG